MKLQTLSQIKNLKNRTVLVRVDYNVAMKKGRILEAERIERSFETINFLVKKGAKVVLISHLGSPEGKFVKDLSLPLIPPDPARPGASLPVRLLTEAVVFPARPRDP